MHTFAVCTVVQCIMMKAVPDRHMTVEGGSRAYPTISFDLCYTGFSDASQLQSVDEGADQEKLTCLVAHCSHTGSIFALPLKDKTNVSMRSAACELIRFIQLLGHGEAELMCDQEPCLLHLQGLLMAARKRLGFRTRIRNPGIGESQANGNVEKSIDVIRSLANVILSQARDNFGLSLGVSHPLFSWAWIHACWLYNRYHVKAGLTSHERASGCRYNGRLLPFAEPCWGYVRPAQKGDARWAMCLFLSKSLINDMFIVATPQGVQLTKSVRRTGQPWATEAALAESVKGVPWDYHLGTIGTKMIPQAKSRPPNAVPVPAVPPIPGLMLPPGLPPRANAPAPAVMPAPVPSQPEPLELPPVPPAPVPGSVASAAPSSRPTLLLDRGDRRPPVASPMDVAGTDPPTTPDSPDLDLSPSGPSGPVPDETLLEDLLPRPGGDASSSAVAPDPKRPRLRSVTIRSLQGSEELHHADEPVEMHFDEELSESLQAYEDELTELLHEPDEVELTADGIPKCLIRDLSDHEPVLDAEELAEVDRHACLYEVQRLTGLSVLCEVPGPLPGHRTLSTKFVVTWRQKVVSGRECWLRRARLVAREFAFLDPHREGLFSPASSAIALKIIPSLYVQQPGWSLMAVDVADAYLTCDQGEPTITSVRLGDRVFWYRLDRCLPGQRDGSARWFNDFSGYLRDSCSTEQMPQMPSVLKFPQQQGGALLHVDDMLAAGVKSVLEDCCSQLRKKYKISVQWVNEVNDELTFLKKRHLLISDGELCIQVHGKHLDRLLELTCLDKAKLRSRQAPMPTGTLPTESENDPLLSDAEASVYRSCVGILLYLQADMTAAQYAIRHLASSMSKPTKGSWSLLRHLVAYLQQHHGHCHCLTRAEPGRGLLVQLDNENVIEAFSDSDWAGCRKTRKSVSGSAFTINGQLVYSASRSQRLIALSSAEAEYHAAISCAIDGILIRSMVEYLFPNPTAPLRILVDNQAARSMMQRQGTGKIRHIHARLLWIQQRVQLGQVVVGPVPTAVNIADLMTKSLSPSRIKFLLHMMNIRDSENGYEAVGAEEAAAQSRMIKICRVHKQVKNVVSHADENMICMLQAFLVAMQAARTLGADEPNEGNDDEDLNGASSYSQQLFTMIFLQNFASVCTRTFWYPLDGTCNPLLL